MVPNGIGNKQLCHLQIGVIVQNSEQWNLQSMAVTDTGSTIGDHFLIVFRASKL